MMISASAITIECLSQEETGLIMGAPLFVCLLVCFSIVVSWDTWNLLHGKCGLFLFLIQKEPIVFPLDKNCDSETRWQIRKIGKWNFHWLLTSSFPHIVELDFLRRIWMRMKMRSEMIPGSHKQCTPFVLSKLSGFCSPEPYGTVRASLEFYLQWSSTITVLLHWNF